MVYTLHLRLLAAALVASAGILIGVSARSASGQDISKWRTDWSQRSVELDELSPGGPPRDGIPAIDHPQFESVGKASAWIEGQEPVVVVVRRSVAKAYPLQILTYHEIVNDIVDGVPITVTFCPLCYSAIAFERTLNGTVHDFGVSGLLRLSDMVMYDRQTESLWQQITGEAIVGSMTGALLTSLPAQIISFDQFQVRYPDGRVMSRRTGHNRPYGRNPYVGYDDIGTKPFAFREKLDGRLPPMERVIAVDLNGETRAYPFSVTRQLRVVHDRVGGADVVVFHANGAVSALDEALIARSREIGSTGVFAPRLNDTTLRFEFRDGGFFDVETGSRWDVTGRAVSGPLAGGQLPPVVHGNYFAFAWFAFRPETVVYGPF